MIKISNVDYINTLPYKHAFINSDFIKKNAVVKGAHPAGCVDELLNHKADIGLVPVGALDMLKDIKLIQEYGIISQKSVDSVLLLSDVPKENLKQVYLDYQSRSSNGFVRILSDKLWKLNFEYLVSKKGYENNIYDKTGGLVIRDRALKLRNKFNYCYDIAEEWYKLTQKPAVLLYG